MCWVKIWTKEIFQKIAPTLTWESQKTLHSFQAWNNCSWCPSHSYDNDSIWAALNIPFVMLILEVLFLMFTRQIMESLFQQPRRMSYSRHTVNDEDLQTESDQTDNFKMHMQVRRMVSDQRNQVRKRRKTTENNVSTHSPPTSLAASALL